MVNAGQKNKIILDSVITLMDNAVMKPGGQNFELATSHLNQYFVNPNPADYALGDAARAFLSKEMPELVLSLKHQSREDVVKDFERTQFLLAHLDAILDAADAGVDVRGYFYWSLLDNFEWAWGYAKRFGIVHVDYDTQVRTAKDSALEYRRVIAARALDDAAVPVSGAVPHPGAPISTLQR